MQPFNNDVTVVGTGRVGLPLALSLLKKGLRVNGIDRDENIINCVAARQMPFNEAGYEEILQQHNFSLDADTSKISDSEYLIITVGTPLRKHIEIELDYIKNVIDQLSAHIRKDQTIILRSTVAPRTTEFVKKYLESRTGYKIGTALFLAYCPERIAEGKALEELETLPQIVGAADAESGHRAEKLFRHLVDDIFITDYITAELSKLFSNISRYIYFAVSNHFMVLADEFGGNIYEIIKMMNYKYPRQIIASPGFTGGTCLRKDFGMINENIPYLDLLLSAWKINEYVPSFVVSHILKRTQIYDKKVAVLGYTFKQDSDDSRDSLVPKLVRYIERQVPKEIRLCEPNLATDSLCENGMENHSLADALQDADIVFIAVNHTFFKLRIRQILNLCRLDTWFADIWNLSDMNKIYFQKMEVPA
jgi:UDP-N-acetyl-D-mannosaminuronic acid dehydrogenase